MEISFAGKRALVTGAGQGIGREIAKALWKGGAETYALSKTQATLDSLKEECAGLHTICLDLADWSATQAKLGPLPAMDMLVNNAGVSKTTPFLEVGEDEIDWIMGINVKSLICVSQTVAKKMVERGSGGAIVNMSSMASKVALRDHTIYCASKGAVDQVTACMALELGPHQIRVNSLNPTVVLTDMGKMAWSDPSKSGPILNRIPLHKFSEIEDVVNACLFLLSDKAAMINGTNLPVDGGYLTC